MNQTELQASLIIYSDNLTQFSINESLNLASTELCEADNIVKMTNKLSDNNHLKYKNILWSISTEVIETYYISEIAKKLMELVENKRDELFKLKNDNKYEIVIAFVAYIYDIVPAADLDSDIIAFAHACNASIYLDWYDYRSTDEDDDN